MNYNLYPKVFLCPNCGTKSNASICNNPQCIRQIYKDRKDSLKREIKENKSN